MNLRLTNCKKQDDKHVAILHSSDNTSVLTFWNESNLQFSHAIVLNQVAKKVVFEKSHRYLAALTIKGGVEVWSVRGAHEAHQWDLNFKSVSDIQANTVRENQFFVLMNSEDNQGSSLDSVLLFQFSRPQNLVNFWKLLIPVTKMVFVSKRISTSGMKSSLMGILLLVNKN